MLRKNKSNYPKVCQFSYICQFSYCKMIILKKTDYLTGEGTQIFSVCPLFYINPHF